MECDFSVIIPVLNESEIINHTIEHIYAISKDHGLEIIVVDGNGSGNTINTVIHKNVKKIISLSGRGNQMNAGAAESKGKILVFLHADTILPDNAFKSIKDVITVKKYNAGAFKLSIDTDKRSLRLIAFTANIRNYFTKIPYGDQTIFMKKLFFESIGRYKSIPILEDLEIMKRIKQNSVKIYIIKDPVITSPRRWLNKGVIYTTLINNAVRILYKFGMKPEKLVKLYYKN